MGLRLAEIASLHRYKLITHFSFQFSKPYTPLNRFCLYYVTGRYLYHFCSYKTLQQGTVLLPHAFSN